MKAVKKHPVPVILATCAVVVVLTLLWYMRPRSWENIAYNGELTRFSANLHTGAIINGHPDFKTYTLEEEDGPEAPGQQILALLDEATYRVNPWDTLAYSLGRGYGETGVGGSTTIYQIWDQGQQAEYFTLFSSGTVIMGHTIYTAKLNNADLYKAIAAVIQEHGTQNN